MPWYLKSHGASQRLAEILHTGLKLNEIGDLPTSQQGTLVTSSSLGLGVTSLQRSVGDVERLPWLDGEIARV